MATITSARFLEGDTYVQAFLADGRQPCIPWPGTGNWQQRLQDWLDEGNTIAPYVPPPPPTDDERIDTAFPQTDVARVIFEALFELTNRVIALEGGNAITRAQLRTWLRNKLP